LRCEAPGPGPDGGGRPAAAGPRRAGRHDPGPAGQRLCSPARAPRGPPAAADQEAEPGSAPWPQGVLTLLDTAGLRPAGANPWVPAKIRRTRPRGGRTFCRLLRSSL